MDDLVAGPLVIPGTELVESFHTSGGPGGQHANRNETAVRLRWRIVDSAIPAPMRERLVNRLGEQMEVTASEQRSQNRNREAARKRLAELVAQALVMPKQRKQTKPTRASRQKRLSAKRAQSKKKRDRRPPGPDD